MADLHIDKYYRNPKLEKSKDFHRIFGFVYVLISIVFLIFWVESKKPRQCLDFADVAGQDHDII